MTNIRKRLYFPYIPQRDSSECGTTCLSMIVNYYRGPNVQPLLRRLGKVNQSHTDLYTLHNLAIKFGFSPEGIKTDYVNLSHCQLPCIAHYDDNHFIVITKATPKKVWITDPAYGKMIFKKEEFLKKWKGILLILTPQKNLFSDPEVQEFISLLAQQKKELKKQHLALLTPFKKLFGIIFILSFLLQALGLGLPFLNQIILDTIIIEKRLILLFAVLAGLWGISLLQIIISIVRNLLLTRFKIDFELKFFSRLFHHLIYLKQSYFDRHKREDFVNRFQENLRIRNILSPSFLQSFFDFIFVINFIIILFFYHVPLTLIALVFLCIISITTILSTPRLRSLQNIIFHKNESAMGSFLDTLLGINTIKLLNLETFKFREWKTRYSQALTEQAKSERAYIYLSVILSGANLMSRVLIIGYGAYLLFQNILTTGQYIAFISIFGYIMISVSSISSLWFSLLEMSVTYEKINDIFIQEQEKKKSGNTGELLHKPDIHFKHVSFHYPLYDNYPVLSDISLTIPFGTSMGIVGRNGSGKTTLLNLITKLYDQYDGTICINDKNLEDIYPGDIRHKIGIVPQKVHLFNGSVKENIICGESDAGEEEIIEAARKADIHDFIESLAFGYEQRIGSHGINLSAGQELKIAFARLFLKKPDIIILDEASSHLDVNTEKLILNNVYSHFYQKTIISVAHRMYTLKQMDFIIVLDMGKIIEHGSHDELMAKNGFYTGFIKTYVDV
ncbi:MAG: peptidase domain-containing ABC transporter [Spirochaetales bacterium]|nr:peptidase domain-containing ABC transporter [Spirochaetales bacterium]